MKIAHLSDTHLGYNGFGRQPLVADPIHSHIMVRQQEADLMTGLERACDAIIDIQPDLVIHSGDLFDSAHPSPRSIAFAQRQLWRLAECNIPVILIEGDHSCPRATKDGHVLSLFDRIPHLHTVYGQPCNLRFGAIEIQALSHQTILRDGLRPPEATVGVDGHILTTHGVADGNHLFKTGRSACDIPITANVTNYAYVALGHCHRFSQVPGTDRAFYAGSTAPVMPNDFTSTSDWGFNLVDLAASPPIVERISVEMRPVNFYGLINAADLSAADIMQYLQAQTAEVPPVSAYCHLTIEDMEPLARRDLAMGEVEEIFAGYSGFKHHFFTRDHKGDARAWSDEAYEERFERLVEDLNAEAQFKQDVRASGLRILGKAFKAASEESDDAASEEDAELSSPSGATDEDDEVDAGN